MGITTKKTIEYARNKFKQCGYELLDNEYKSATTKMLFKNKQGYIAKIPLSHVCENLTIGTFFKKNNEYIIENIKTYLKLNTKCSLNTDSFEFSPTSFINLKCKCGNSFNVLWHSVYRNNNILCTECTNRESRGLNKISEEEVLKNLLANGYKPLSDYKTNKESLEVLELDTGYIGFASYPNLLNKTKIKPFILPLNEKNYINNLRRFVKINNGNIEIIDYSKKTNSSKSVSLRCKCECGDNFTIGHGTIISNRGTVYCEKCNKKLSNLERKSMLWLDKNKIEYIRQYKFIDCKNILQLPFDFYLPKYNMCIECDGEQHYRGDTQYDKKEDAFSLRIKRDNIKNEYCRDKNIKLLRIPYWDFNKNIYKQILIDNILGQN